VVQKEKASLEKQLRNYRDLVEQLEEEKKELLESQVLSLSLSLFLSLSAPVHVLVSV
jgi:hypothetical protein